MAEVSRFDRELNAEAIVEITESIGTWLKEHKIKSRNRTLFMLESILLDLDAHYKDKQDITVCLLKKLGHSSIRIIYDGEAFNPSENNEASPQTLFFLENLGLAPAWSYKNNRNEITLEIPRNHLKDESLLIIAAVASVISGFILPFLPGAAVTFISEYILETLSDIFMNLLGVFAGILIFFSILSGVCGMGNIADLNKKGKYMLSRTMIVNALGAVFGGLVLIPFFKFSYGGSGGSSGMKEIYAMIVDIIPSNPISPFMDGNMLQISVIAIFSGTVIIMLGNKVDQVKDLVLQCNTLILSIVEIICRLLPVYIYTNLTLLFLNNGLGIILTIWKPLLICLIINAILVFLKLMKISVKYKVGLPVLFRKVYPSFMIGLTTASSMAAFGTSLEINENKLGIDKGYSNFATPLKNQLHCLNGVIGFFVVIYYLTEYSGTAITPFWFLSVWIIVFLINPAIPPVSGGTLICIGVIMDQFGIPDTCLGMAATLILVFDFIMTSAKIVIVHMEEIEEADHFGLLDLKVLQKADAK